MTRPVMWIVALSLALSGVVPRALAGETVLWADAPAGHWHEAYPVGNGRLGALVHGGTDREVIHLNESGVWSGQPYDREEPGTPGDLAEARRLIFEGRRAEAHALVQKSMTMKPDPRYGAYQPLGDLVIDFPSRAGPSSYRRSLDLRTGVVTVGYDLAGTTFRREVFASAPDRAIVVRVMGDSPGWVTLGARLARARGATTRPVSSDEIEMSGRCDFGGSAFSSRLRVRAAGGRTAVDGDRVEVTGADAVDLIVTATCDLSGTDQRGNAGADARSAATKTYEELKSAAVADHRALFDRVRLDLGTTSNDLLPTAARLKRLADRPATEADPGLVALQFQYGRYLLIASSRAGGMPANLQGIWNPEFAPPWFSDYTINVNFQMNYWPAETCGLPESAGPMFDYLERLREPGRRVARQRYGVGGIALGTRSTPWLNTDLRGSAGLLWQEACGWLARHLWEHYLFSGDEAFLASRAYPFMKEASEFYLDFLVAHPRTGLLVTGPTTSPENGYVTADGRRAAVDMGPAMAQQVVRELLANTARASELLGVDGDLRLRLRSALDRLAPDRIGGDGRLLEWSEELAEAEPGHRHNSHLYALYPGEQITPSRTPELAEACRKVLLARRKNGAASIGWSGAWKVNCWARLGDGGEALTELHSLLARSTAPNLFGLHDRASGPVFQVDGNFGVTSGVAEMLLQSHADEVRLLPALPASWSSGSVVGLRARGGFRADVAWSAGRLTRATLRSDLGRPLRLRTSLPIIVRGGKSEVAYPAGSLCEVPTTRGEAYEVVPQPQ